MAIPFTPRSRSGVTLRINPTQSAQYGADLVREKMLREELQKQDLTNKVKELTERQDRIDELQQRTVPIRTDTDPRMGYTNPWAAAAQGEYDRAGQDEYNERALRERYADYVEPDHLTGGGKYDGDYGFLPDHLTGETDRGPGRRGSGQNFDRGAQGAARRRHAAAADAVQAYLDELEYERRQLEAKRDEALAEAKDDIAFQYDNQIKDINEDIDTLTNNLSDLRGRVPSYLETTQARFDQAVEAAQGIVEAAGPELEAVRNQALKGIEAGYDSAAEGLAEELDKIGAGDQAATDLEAMVRELEGLAYETVEGQIDDVAALNEAAENVAITAAESAGITDEAQVKRFSTNLEKDLKKSIDDLVERRTRLEEAKTRAWDKAQEKINEQFTEALGEVTYQSQLEFANGVLTEAMDAWFADNDFDVFERQDMMATWDDLLNEGVVNFSQFKEWYGTLQSERNQLLTAIANATDAGAADVAAELQEQLARLPSLDPEMVEGIEMMYSIWDQSLQEWHDNQPNPADFGFSGSGTGAANTDINNVRAAKNGEGVYGQRVRYTADVGRYIKDKWGVEVQGINYFRPISAEGGGQARNSDHKTAGAIDIMLNPNDQNDMRVGAQIMRYLRGLGTTAYTIWEPTDPNDAHFDHIHVSFKLGATGSPYSYDDSASGGGGARPE